MINRTLMAAAGAAALALLSASPASAATWAVQPVPLPAGATNGHLEAVSCPSAATCIAVGDWNGKSGLAKPLAEQWNGSTWSIQGTPLPAGGKRGNLAGVSCVSATDCTAVGNHGTTSTAGVPLAEQWNGSTWAVQPVPLPAGASGDLIGVSCASAAMCTAVGDYSPSTGAVLTLAEQWDGSTWTMQSTPTPPGSANVQLSGVSCASAASCTAVGGYFGAAGPVSLAEQWNGSSWSIASTVNPGTSAGLGDVSCVAATDCTAVGGYSPSTGADLPLAEHWDGSAWSVQPTLAPAGASMSGLSGISCTAAHACTAAGSFIKSSTGSTRPLAEFWNGSAWKLQATAPSPTFKALSGISCTAAHACTAVGFSHHQAAGFTPLLAERES